MVSVSEKVSEIEACVTVDTSVTVKYVVDGGGVMVTVGVVEDRTVT